MKKTSINSMGYFNLLRGLGILSVIVGHTVEFVWPSEEGAFSPFMGMMPVFGGGVMAMFFMISGFYFFKRKTRKCIKIQLQMILKPYYIATGLVLVTKVLLAILFKRSFFEHSGNLILTYLLAINCGGGGTLFGIPVDMVGIFWFLWALFGSWVIYNTIVQIKNIKIQRILTVSAVVLGYFLTTISTVWPFTIPMSLIGTGYIAIGELCRKYQLLEREIPKKMYILLVIPILISMTWGYVNISICVWRLGLLDVLSTCCLGFLLLRIYPLIKTDNAISRKIETIGFYSLWILCIHGYENIVVPWHWLWRIFPENKIVVWAVCLIGRAILIWILFHICNRVNSLLGEKHRRGVK